MDSNVAFIVVLFIFFGWIPILSIGKAISYVIEAYMCNKCTCKNCIRANGDKINE